LQFRHKDFWSREVFAQAQEIAALCSRAGALFIVNDRADYAALLHAGLHLGQDDLLPADARIVIGPAPVVGFSTHNPDQMRAAAAEPVDYVAFGPVFPTSSKERPDPSVGIEGFCWKAGADSVALISSLFPTPATHQALRDRMAEWVGLSST
jgi:thiamine-phosphate pyrophosphorylase